MTTIAHVLITKMFQDHLLAAEEMVKIGNLDMARYELQAALETLSQLKALNPVPAPTEHPVIDIH